MAFASKSSRHGRSGAKVSGGTVAKWMARYRAEGSSGLQDRSSCPASSPRRASNAQVAVVLALRLMRLPGFQIARQSRLSKATVSRLLAPHGLSKQPAKPIVPLLAPASWRAHPSRHQETGPHRAPQPSGHRRLARPGGGWEYVTWPLTTPRVSPLLKSPTRPSRAPCASSINP